MFGSWNVSASGYQSAPEDNSVQVEEVWERCSKCMGTGILVIEDWVGNWSYKKCDICKGAGKTLVDVIVG